MDLGPRKPPGIPLLGLVVGIALHPRRPPIGGIGDDAIEQGSGDAVAPVRRGDHETRDPDDGLRGWAIRVDEPQGLGVVSP